MFLPPHRPPTPPPIPNNAYVGALALNVTVFGEMAFKDLIRLNEVRRAEALPQQDWVVLRRGRDSRVHAQRAVLSASQRGALQ